MAPPPPPRAAELFRKYSIYRLNCLKISHAPSSRPMFRRTAWPKILRPRKTMADYILPKKQKPLRRRKSPRRQIKLDDACELFFKIGCSRRMLTVKNIYKHGYTFDEFLRLIGPILCIKDEGVLRQLCSVEQFSKFINDLQYFINHMKWLQISRNGITMIDEILDKDRISKKRAGQLKNSDLDLARKLVDYGASRWLDRQGIHNQIAELERRRRQLEIKSVDIDNHLKDKLGPLHEYQELPIDSVRIEAYKIYEKDCFLNGTIPIGKDEMGYSTAMEAFGEVVKECHVLNYLNNPGNKSIIEDHLKKQVETYGERNTDGSELQG